MCFEHETSGNIIQFKVFELLVLFLSVRESINWMIYIKNYEEIVVPVGLANYININYLFSEPWMYIHAGLIILFSIAGFIRKSKYSYLVVLILFHILYAARFSFGKVSHGANFLGISLLILFLSFLFYSKPEIRRKFVFEACFFLFGIAYVSAGISKLIGTGLHWPDGQHLLLWIAEKQIDQLSQYGETSLNALQLLITENYWLATCFLLIGLIIELSGFLLWFKKSRPWIALILVGMHIGILFTMNILFDQFILFLVIMALPWFKIIDKYLINIHIPAFLYK